MIPPSHQQREVPSVMLFAMCCTLCLNVLALAFAVMLLYMGVHFADVKCDEPLATLLILYGSSMVLSLFGFMCLQQFRKMEGEGTFGGSALVSSCSVIVGCGGLYGLVVFVLGNVWVFSSDTCATTAGTTEFMGWDLYNWAFFVVLVSDVFVGLALVVLCCVVCVLGFTTLDQVVGSVTRGRESGGHDEFGAGHSSAA